MSHTKKSRRPSCRHRDEQFDPIHLPGVGTDPNRVVRTCVACGRVRIVAASAPTVCLTYRIAKRRRERDAERIRLGKPIDEATLPQKGDL